MAEGSDRRRIASRRRGPSPPMPREEELEEEVAPMDELDEELVWQTDEKEGPHDDESPPMPWEAAGTGSASSDSSSSVYL